MGPIHTSSRLASLAGAYLTVIALAGCMPGYIAPGPGVARTPRQVPAPFDTTWSAVISHFAERNISIRTIEKASGIIVAEASRASDLPNREYVRGKNGKIQYFGGRPLVKDGPAIYAECGSFQKRDLDPTAASFNVRVTGDARSSTLQVNVRFVTTYSADRVDAGCTSSGRLETELEEAVLRRLKP